MSRETPPYPLPGSAGVEDAVEDAGGTRRLPGGRKAGNKDNTNAMTAEQHASEGRHNVASSRHRSPAGGAGAGLSIVVRVYNEAAGLAELHARINAVATALRDERGLAC